MLLAAGRGHRLFDHAGRAPLDPLGTQPLAGEMRAALVSGPCPVDRVCRDGADCQLPPCPAGTVRPHRAGRRPAGRGTRPGRRNRSGGRPDRGEESAAGGNPGRQRSCGGEESRDLSASKSRRLWKRSRSRKRHDLRPWRRRRRCKQLAATASAASGWQMAEAAGKYLQDFSTAHAAELNKVVATLTSAPPAPACDADSRAAR